MLVEGSEHSDVVRTFKRKVVGGSVYPKCKKKQLTTNALSTTIHA
jgi:hypothetical protein